MSETSKMKQTIKMVSYNIHGLPWQYDNDELICQYLIESNADILCLQEVFTPLRVSFVIKILQMAGYRVFLPNDSYIQTLFGSGLMICVHNRLKASFVCNRFTPYLNYSNFDIFASKGFYAVVLYINNQYVRIINTHMQSDCEINNYTGTLKTSTIRRLQAKEIVDTYKTSKIPTIIIGDLNESVSLNPWFSYKCCSKCEKLVTFPEGLQNLDHFVVLKNDKEDCLKLSEPFVDNTCLLSDHSPLFMKLTI